MFRFPTRKTQTAGVLDLDNIDAVLFDLDGTLIDVDMQRFVPGYLRRLTERLSDFGNPRRIAEIMRQAVYDMLTSSDGQYTMEERLLNRVSEEFGITDEEYRSRLELFIHEDLAELQPLVKGHPQALELLETCQAQGWKLALATNPIFPRAVVDARMVWGGLDQGHFHVVTTYETARYCKPHPGYFHDVMAKLDVAANSCLMVGNDTEHDLSAGKLGLQTCLLTTWQIDRAGGRYAADWEGGHEELLAVLRTAS